MCAANKFAVGGPRAAAWSLTGAATVARFSALFRLVWWSLRYRHLPGAPERLPLEVQPPRTSPGAELMGFNRRRRQRLCETHVGGNAEFYYSVRLHSLPATSQA